MAQKHTKKSILDQPLSSVEWLDRSLLRPNDYNPNKVASPEMRLLKTSILEDGWTQPIVANSDGTIVDGFHRWTVSGDKEVSAMTGGLIPVVRLKDKSEGDRRMATIRHNRARGVHGVLAMSAIVADMIEEGLSVREIMKRLSMEREEVERLANQSGILEFVEGEFSESEEK